MESSSQNQAGNIILGNCLSCQGLVRVPVKADAKAKVRCPHCADSYFLWQVLDKAVPELELVEELKSVPQIPRVDQVSIRKSDEPSEPREVFVVPSQLSKGAKRSRRHRSGGSDSQSERSETSSGRGDGSRDSGRSRRHTEREKAERSSNRTRHVANERSTMFEMLKVLVGGLLAIPIAYLLVLWISHQDPLNVAPTLNNVAPILVPANLRVDEPEESSPKPAVQTPEEEDDPLDVPDLDPEKVLKDIGL